MSSNRFRLARLGRGVGRLVLAAALAWTGINGVVPAATTLALATDQEAVSSVITADVLTPPTTVRCTGGLLVCNAGLLSRPVLTWTPTPDTYATGYVILRSTTSGSGYTQIASVSDHTTSTWTDTTTGLSVLTTYYYVIRSVAPVWTSLNSNQVTVTIALGL